MSVPAGPLQCGDHETNDSRRSPLARAVSDETGAIMPHLRFETIAANADWPDGNESSRWSREYADVPVWELASLERAVRDRASSDVIVLDGG